MIEKKKSHKVLWTFLIFLLVIIAFVGGFFISKLFTDKKDEPKKEEKVVKEIAVESEKVELSLKSLGKLAISEAILYKGDKFDIVDITDEQLLSTSLKQIPSEYIGYCGGLLEKEPASLELINRYLKPVIMDKEVTFEMIKKLATYHDEYYGVYETQVDGPGYYAVKGNDIYIGNVMCEGEPTAEILRQKVVKAEELDDYLYIYEKRAFYDVDFEAKTFKYYSDPLFKNLVETKKATVVDVFYNQTYNQTEDLNWDKYNTYKYTFKLVDGHYYFKTIELVK